MEGGTNAFGAGVENPSGRPGGSGVDSRPASSDSPSGTVAGGDATGGFAPLDGADSGGRGGSRGRDRWGGSWGGNLAKFFWCGSGHLPRRAPTRTATRI